jgi:hypothetical protein
VDENGNIFRIEDLYDLNSNESKSSNYIEKYILWRTDKCCGKHPDYPISQ